MDRIFIKTFGCSQNSADSEIIAGELKKKGFAIVNRFEECDVVVINSCIVKHPTESAVLRYLKLCSLQGKKIVVAGCLPQSSPQLIEGYSMIGPSQIHHIAEVVEETLQGNTVTLLVDEKTQKLKLPRIRRSKTIEIIPISSGCLGDCSYCIVRFARGVLVSYDREDILRRVREAVRDGINQIWLTSQDTGCYGMDNDDGYLLTHLLKDICSLPGFFRVRLGMANPNHVKMLLPDLISCFASEKMYRFLHVPVQSGSDAVLTSMRRNYSVRDFTMIVREFREQIPEISIATDVICGFPGETDEQFMSTISLIRDLKIEVVNRSRFWIRQGTDAEKMAGKLNPSLIKDRSRYLSSVIERVSYENNRRWRGWSGYALVEEEGKDDTLVARNDSYKPIILCEKLTLGSRVHVRIDASTVYDLRGSIIGR